MNPLPFVFRILPALVLTMVAASGVSAQAATFSLSYSPTTIGPGASSAATYTIDNSGEITVADSLAFSHTLPAGMTIASPSNASTTCTNGSATAVLSAPAGGGTLSLTDGGVGVGDSCTVTLQVTATTTGAATTGTLTSSQGSHGTASATLTVDTALPGFSKSFAPSTVDLNAITTLTYTIDNSVSAALIGSLDFSESLPAGLQVASPANASSTCVASDTTVTATPGSSSITLDANGTAFSGFEVLGAGATCTVAVDVQAIATGTHVATSGDLLADFVSAGSSTTSLVVNDLSTVAPTLTKVFSGDPVAPGGSVTLSFTLFNADASNAATAIAFTDDLDAMLSGATASGLPTDPCGSGSTLTGSSFLTLSGGVLAARDSCTFDVTVDIPGVAAAGNYTNTTSTVTAMVNGSPVTSVGTASDTLEVLALDAVPPSIAMSWSDADAGTATTVTYTLTNNATLGATDMAFLSVLNPPLPYPTSATLPAGGTCDGTTALVFVDTDIEGFSYSGGTLAAGTSCTITVPVTLPSYMPVGSHSFTTDEITATINGATRTGNTATASLSVSPGALGISFAKAFDADTVATSSTVGLDFTITLSGDSADATAISFTDDLNAFHSGAVLTSVDSNSCGGSASGTSTLSFSGGALTAGNSCTIATTITLGAATGSFTNTTSTLTATPDGGSAASQPGTEASDNLTILDAVPVELGIELAPSTVVAGGTSELTFSLENPAGNPTDATAIAFTINLGRSGGALTDLAATSTFPISTCGGTLSDTFADGKFLSFAGGTLAAGASCDFSVDVLVPAGSADGSYTLSGTAPDAIIDGGGVTGVAATDLLTVDGDILLASKSFIDDPVLAGETATLRFTIENTAAGDAVTAIAFTDDLDAMLTSTVATGLPAAACGGTLSGTDTLTLTGGALAAADSCTFDVTVLVPAGASDGSYTNTTSTFTGDIGGLAVSGAAVSDTLQVTTTSPPSFALDILGDPTPAEGELTYRFTITNNDSSSTISDLEFTNDLDAVLSGLVATGGTGSNICGSGSSLSGTSFLAFSGGTIDPSSSCSFDVSVQVPASPTDGSYTNTTSDLLSNGLSVANATSDSFTVDATDPTLSAIDLIAGSDTGSSDSDDETADSSPTVEFTAESGATIEIDWGNGSGFVSASVGTGAAQQETIGTAYGRDGDKTIEVRATDATGNQVSQSLTIHIDTTNPDVTLTSDTSSLVTGQTATITFDFSEDVVGFDDGDVTITGGTLSSVAVDGSDSTIYTAVFTPTTDITGSASITVVDASYNDVAGNTGTAGASPSISIDTMAPGVTLTSDVVTLGVGETATITFTFTDTPTGFEDSDITVTGGTLSAVTVDSSDPTIYTAVFTPTDGSTDTPSITVAAGSYTDAVGNAGTEGISPSITVDTDASGVTLSADAAILSGVFQVTATFDEVMIGFQLADITVGNGTASNLASSDDTVFTFDVTPQSDGEVTIDIAAGVAQDAVGNDNAAADQLSITSDSTAPSVEITGPSDAVGGLFQATVTFSEDVIGFQQGDLTIAHGIISNFAGSGDTYTFDVIPEIGETVVIGLAAGVAEDAAGNSNLAAVDYSVRGSSPAQEFEEHREEIRDIVKNEAYTRLNAQVLANTRMVRQARNRFILGKSQLDDPGGGLASRNNLNFDVDGSLEFVDRAFSTRGVFSQQRGNFEGSYRRILFGDFDLSRDENGTVSAYLSGKIAWEHMINDQTMLGYNIGLDLGRSDIEGSFSGSQDSIGVSIGGYFVSQLAERVYADGFISFGVGRNNLDLDNGTLALSSDYDSYTTMVGAALTGVYEMSGYELWPELSFTYGYTDIGVIGLTGTAFGLTDSSLTLDAGYVALGTLSFAPEFIIPMDGRPALESNRMLSFKPNVTCEMVKSGSSTSNCGGGVALGLYAVSRDGQALLDAKVRIDRIGDVTRTGLELSFDYAF